MFEDLQEPVPGAVRLHDLNLTREEQLNKVVELWNYVRGSANEPLYLTREALITYGDILAEWAKDAPESLPGKCGSEVRFVPECCELETDAALLRLRLADLIEVEVLEEFTSYLVFPLDVKQMATDHHRMPQPIASQMPKA